MSMAFSVAVKSGVKRMAGIIPATADGNEPFMCSEENTSNSYGLSCNEERQVVNLFLECEFALNPNKPVVTSRTERASAIGIRENLVNETFHWSVARNKTTSINSCFEQEVAAFISDVKEEEAIDHWRFKRFNVLATLLLLYGPPGTIIKFTRSKPMYIA